MPDDAVEAETVDTVHVNGVLVIKLVQGAEERAHVETATMDAQELAGERLGGLKLALQSDNDEAASDFHVLSLREAIQRVELLQNFVLERKTVGDDDVEEGHLLLGRELVQISRCTSFTSVLEPLLSKSITNGSQVIGQDRSRIERWQARRGQPRVPVDGIQSGLGKLLLGEVLDEMSLDLSGGDGFPHVSSVQAVDPSQHLLATSNLGLEEVQEQASLLIGDLGEGLIGVNAGEIRLQLSKLIVRSQIGNGLLEIIVTNQHLEVTNGLRVVDLSENLTLEVNTEPLINPEVGPA